MLFSFLPFVFLFEIQLVLIDFVKNIYQYIKYSYKHSYLYSLLCTLSQLHTLVKDKFLKLDVSRRYLQDIIRDNNITYKRAIFEYFPKTYRGEERDETSISTSLSVNYCREDLGKRYIIKTDDNAVFKKYSLVVAIINKKMFRL